MASWYEDAWDATGGRVVKAVNAGADVVTSALSRIPGGNLLMDAAGGGLDALSSLAKTIPGQIVLTAVSGGMAAYFATYNLPILNQAMGPQLASAFWALPGVARGEPFAQAYMAAFIERMRKLAEYFGGEAAAYAANQLGPAIDYLKSIVPAELQGEELAAWLAKAGITPESLAYKLGIRPDVAAEALNGMIARAMYDVESFDLKTGRRLTKDALDSNKKHLNLLALYLGPVAKTTAQMVDPKIAIKRALLEEMGVKAPAPAPVAAPATPRPQLPAFVQQAKPQDEEKGTSTALIVGGVAAVGVLAAGAYFLTRKKSRR